MFKYLSAYLVYDGVYVVKDLRTKKVYQIKAPNLYHAVKQVHNRHKTLKLAA